MTPDPKAVEAAERIRFLIAKYNEAVESFQTLADVILKEVDLTVVQAKECNVQMHDPSWRTRYRGGDGRTWCVAETLYPPTMTQVFQL